MYPFKAVIDQRQDNGYANKHSSGHNNRNIHHNNRHNKNKKDFTTSYYVYGKSAAIEFVCDETKKQRINTITMHAASSRSEDEKGYEWDNKTIVQIPRNELPIVTAIMLGLTPRGEFRQSGLHASKSYTIEHQNEKVFFMVMERGKPIRAVALSPEDTYQVISLFLKQLKKNSPWMSVNEIVQLIELTIVKMKSARKNMEHDSNAVEDHEAAGEEDLVDADDDYLDEDSQALYLDRGEMDADKPGKHPDEVNFNY